MTGRVAQGDFKARAMIRSNDEIAVLAQGFNNMAGNIQSLIDKIKEDEQKLRKTDLRLLQEQINPHFLYNTLDTIVWLIESNETDQAVNMVVTLSDFFRLVLSKGKEFISIGEEERHIRSYLEIQEMRYRDILEYEIRIGVACQRHGDERYSLIYHRRNTSHRGVGNIIGTFFGVLSLSTIQNIVSSVGLDQAWWTGITIAAMLCLFLVIQSVVMARKNRLS